MMEDVLARVPPHNLEAEQSVLGAVLLDNDSINLALETVTAQDFYREAHREIFRAMVELSDLAHPVDAVTLIDALRNRGKLELIGGAAYIAELASIVPTSANIAHYARIVRDKALLRRVAVATGEIQSGCFDNPPDVDSFLDGAERRLLDTMDTRQHAGPHPMQETAREAIAMVEHLYETRENLTGVPTGFVDLDRLTAGLQPGNLIVIAARPSMGKTALALNIAVNAATRKDGINSGNDGINSVNTAPTNVMFFSLEMTRQELGLRMLCSEARVDSARVRAGRVSKNEFPELLTCAERLCDTPVWIDDNCDITPMQLKAACRRLKAQHNLGLVMVDYLQLMAPSRVRDNREREVAEISRSLKSLAKELAIPVIAMSQLNRQVESRADRRPMLADLRESGAIEQDADLIAFIYRDEMYHRDSKQKGVAEIIIAKQRNGPCDTVYLTYSREFTRFDNYTPQEDR